jgi:tetratricopeptide (TPR) repeat protein
VAELSPDNANIYNNMGIIYEELKKYDRAIEEFLRAV